MDTKNMEKTYNFDSAIIKLNTLLKILKELKDSGVEEVFIMNKYFNYAKDFDFEKIGYIKSCIYLSISDMEVSEATNLIKSEKENYNINHTYEI
ncbi:hypothetical protein [uncultured Brachyspira sp.]|uniref:hypothetical protein n=1 Tax=uncultured Brachyspira sp. TaxID=221953 RepID=UPI002589F30F|nr:hypothetical protein [uncultured Brachyspira sp.]